MNADERGLDKVELSAKVDGVLCRLSSRGIHLVFSGRSYLASLRVDSYFRMNPGS